MKWVKIATEVLQDKACECVVEDSGTCIYCVCEGALEEQQQEIERLRAELETYRKLFGPILRNIPANLASKDGNVPPLFEDVVAGEEEVEECDICGFRPGRGNVVYEDDGRRPLCPSCNKKVGG